MTDNIDIHCTKLIRDKVGFFNGWSVSDEAEKDACERAAKAVRRYLKKKLRQEILREFARKNE